MPDEDTFVRPAGPSNYHSALKVDSANEELFVFLRVTSLEGTRGDVAVATGLPLATRADKYLKRLFFNLGTIESDESNEFTFDDAAWQQISSEHAATYVGEREVAIPTTDDCCERQR